MNAQKISYITTMGDQLLEIRELVSYILEKCKEYCNHKLCTSHWKAYTYKGKVHKKMHRE